MSHLLLLQGPQNNNNRVMIDQPTPEETS